MIKGKHLIGGEWVGSESSFKSSPSKGQTHEFNIGTPKLIDKAAKKAEEAFSSYGYISRKE